jgi:hypothetical protein
MLIFVSICFGFQIRAFRSSSKGAFGIVTSQE